jgi:flagellar biosynthesis protein FlhG
VVTPVIEPMSVSPDRPPLEQQAPTLWAVGGGKGGVGKSVLATNLGVALARRGFTAVLVDADLGGANLHTLLGMPHPPLSLSDFVLRRVGTLAEVAVPTTVGGLSLVSGARALLDMANPKSAHKERILRQVTGLPADHVILDVGSGSSFNVLDFFLAARVGVVVVVPEATSVENAYHFIRAGFFRRLRRAEPRARVREVMEEVLETRRGREVRAPRDIIPEVERVEPEVGRALRREAENFRPMVVVNRVEREEQERLGEDMASACRRHFGCAVTCPGVIAADPLVGRSVELRRPALEVFPESPFARSLLEVVRAITATTEAAS